MFGFEAWHLWAVGSVLAAGANSFIIKVAAQRSHAPIAMSTWASAVSVVCALGAVWRFGFDASPFIVAIGAVAGILLVIGLIARSYGLAHVHATLFFPIYKIIGPALVLVAGLTWFGERLTQLQTFGMMLVFLVPLLLIDRLERTRQNDLVLGIWLAAVSAFFISTTQIMSKIASHSDSSMAAFVLMDYLFAALAGIFLLRRRSGAVVQAEKRAGELYLLAIAAGITQFLGFLMLIFAYRSGPMSTIYAINSTYIVIPIVLSIIFYGEHWNARKLGAVALSVVAVVLLR